MRDAQADPRALQTPSLIELPHRRKCTTGFRSHRYKFEIYVVPFPNTLSGKWAVSTSGGTTPKWSNSGKELFYVDATGNLVEVEVKIAPTFSFGQSTTLFRAAEFRSAAGNIEYAVARDDRRFLMIRLVAGNTPDKLIVVDNWFEELKGKSRK